MLGFKTNEELLKIAAEVVSKNALPGEEIVDVVPQARVESSLGYSMLFGAVASALTTRFFMLILTNKRLVVSEQGMTFNILRVNSYPLNQVKLIQLKRGLLQYKMVLLLPGQTEKITLLMPKNGPWKSAPEKIAAALKS